MGGEDYGGQLICDLQFLQHWNNIGVKVDAYILGDGPAVEKYVKFFDNYKIIPPLKAEFGGGFKAILKGIKNSKAYVTVNKHQTTLENEYDAILYQSQGYVFLAAYFAKKYRTKAYWYMPNSINRFFGKLYYNIVLRLKNITPVANSIYTKKSLGKICKYYIYPGYDVNRVKLSSHSNFRTNLNIGDNEIIFGTAARITPMKAQDLLIEAFVKSDILRATKAHLLIAGIPEDQNFYETCLRIAENDLDRIHFLENVDDMKSFYNTIDIYVNSRRDAEPFGISIAESLGAGLPVISNSLGGPSEMITDQINGWLVRSPDSRSYKKTMELAISNKENWPEMSITNRKRAELFTSNRGAELFLEILIP